MKSETESSEGRRDIGRFHDWAPTYDQSALQRLFFLPIQSRMLVLLGAELQGAPRTILDVGCGTGRLLRAASLRWPEAQLWGIDPAPGMVAEATRLNPHGTFTLAPAEAIPHAEESVDLVLTSMSFHHWSDQSKGLREIARVLRPRGWFCLADHHFFPAKLFRERIKSRDEIRALVTAARLGVRSQPKTGVPFVSITLAQK